MCIRDSYEEGALLAWARRVVSWATGGEPEDADRVPGPAVDRAPRDVFVYFDNDAKVRAPQDAQTLMRLVATL